MNDPTLDDLIVAEEELAKLEEEDAKHHPLCVCGHYRFTHGDDHGAGYGACAHCDCPKFRKKSRQA